MIHCPSSDIAFVHIPRTAGTSITWRLHQLPPLEKVGHQHAPLTAEIRASFPGRHFFCVVRNPWERHVSLYRANRWRGFTSFHRWLEWLPRFIHGRPQLHYVADAAGQFLVDTVLRYESLEEDFARFSQGRHLGLASLDPDFRKNGTGAYDWRRYYDTMALRLAAPHVETDAERLGYRYE